MWFDDFMQIGLSALDEAIGCWDAERKVKFNGFFRLILSRRFSTFIARRGYHIRVYDGARKRGWKSPSVVSYDYLTTDAEQVRHFSLANRLCYNNTLDDYMWQDFVKKVDIFAKAYFTEKQYKVFKCWYIDGEVYQHVKAKLAGLDNVLYGKQKYIFDEFFENCRKELV